MKHQDKEYALQLIEAMLIDIDQITSGNISHNIPVFKQGLNTLKDIIKGNA